MKRLLSFICIICFLLASPFTAFAQTDTATASKELTTLPAVEESEKIPKEECPFDTCANETVFLTNNSSFVFEEASYYTQPPIAKAMGGCICILTPNMVYFYY